MKNGFGIQMVVWAGMDWGSQLILIFTATKIIQNFEIPKNHKTSSFLSIQSKSVNQIHSNFDPEHETIAKFRMELMDLSFEI